MHHIIESLCIPINTHIYSYYSWTHKQPKKKLVAHWHIRNKQRRNTLTCTKEKRQTAESAYTNKDQFGLLLIKKKHTVEANDKSKSQKHKNNYTTTNTAPSTSTEIRISRQTAFHRETRISRKKQAMRCFFYLLFFLVVDDDDDDNDEMVLETYCLDCPNNDNKNNNNKAKYAIAESANFCTHKKN